MINSRFLWFVLAVIGVPIALAMIYFLIYDIYFLHRDRSSQYNWDIKRMEDYGYFVDTISEKTGHCFLSVNDFEKSAYCPYDNPYSFSFVGGKFIITSLVNSNEVIFSKCRIFTSSGDFDDDAYSTTVNIGE